MSARVRVKICGLTRIEDARLAVDLGADAIGMIFWPQSPRVVNVEQARAICCAVPPFVTRVGVFVNLPPHDVAGIAQAVDLDVVQLHGDEDLEVFGRVGRRLLKTVSLTADDRLADVAAWPEHVMPLVDAHDATRRGGTGRVANWPRAALLARRRSIVLAGGLTPDNVGDAIRQVRPWAVDVSSGVERGPGVKSAERLRAFFNEVEAAGRQS